MLIRNALVTTGGVTAGVAQDDAVKVVGAFVTIVSIIWGLYSKYEANRKATAMANALPDNIAIAKGK